ncbi:uncharacterized protein LOC114943181 isoform X1 [Nylanderia fulva]|uniref:uncharacterized protein LOC114943181 isoform X1 n=1 Tax=Nylanderia fulva TaxID=613905 RepID=UPI0010FB4031|nr:uncharacterized protein LOC114943181 isoform X1 [Nylanderia fulva]XP_029174598.1 uncharacterized protein LOC114943181 isoform X1 [Nylanderia fulva]
MTSSKFCIVHFMEEDTVEVVPDFWIKESAGILQCQWPNTSFPAKSVIRRTIPHQDWPVYQCRILGTFDDYDTARLNLKEAEVLSDFPSKNVQSSKRSHKRNPRYFSDDDSLSDEVNIKKKKPGSSHNQSVTKTSIYVSDSSNSSNEQKENRRPNKSNIQLPKAFEDKHKQVQKAILPSYEAPTKKSATLPKSSYSSSSEDYRKHVAEDNTRQECSMWDNQEDQRANSSISKLKFQTSSYIGETEFEKRILCSITRLQIDVKEIRDVVEKIYEEKYLRNTPDVKKYPQRNIRNAQEEELTNILPDFPLKTLNNWQELETLLSNSKTAREQLKNMFFNRGGKNGGEHIRRILRAMFEPCLAKKISWQGLKNNEKFDGTLVSCVLFDSVKQHFKIDDRNIELAIINWFRRSSERISKNPEDNNSDT